MRLLARNPAAFARQPDARRLSPAEPSRTGLRAHAVDRELGRLMDQISRGSHNAFGTLFDRTSGPVHDQLESCLPDPGRLIAVFAGTYVEVWWLAGCHTDPGFDVVRWIHRIAERRFAGESPHPRDAVVDRRSCYAAVELATLLDRPVEWLGHQVS